MNETTKSISDDTNDLTDDRSTVAGRIAAAGGAGLHQQVLQLGHDFEKRRQAIRTDRKLNDAYRAEQLAALDGEEEEAFYDAQSRETAEAAQAFERRKAEIVGKMKAEHAPASRARDQIETSADQLERHFRSTRDLVALQVEIEVAKSITAPDDLEDTLAELMTAGRDDRVRRLGPVILARLQDLSAKKGGRLWRHSPERPPRSVDGSRRTRRCPRNCGNSSAKSRSRSRIATAHTPPHAKRSASVLRSTACASANKRSTQQWQLSLPGSLTRARPSFQSFSRRRLRTGSRPWRAFIPTMPSWPHRGA